MYAERLFFNQHISELPEEVMPDFVVMVAPSPESIQVMLDELESKVNEKINFLFVIEHQSRNAVDGGSEEAIESINQFLRNIGKSNIEVDRSPENLELTMPEYFERIGLERGGELNTSPWNVSDRWKIVMSS